MPQQFTSDSPTIDEIRALKKPRRLPVDIPLDGDSATRMAELRDEIRFAEREDMRLNRAAQAPALQRELETLIDGMAVATFVFQQLPKKVYRDLIEACPPPDRDRSRLRWDPAKFEPALIAASCIQPKLTIAIIEDMFSQPDGAWGEAEFKRLFNGAYDVNEVLARVPFGGNGSEPTPDSEPNSTTAAPEA